MNHRLDVLRWVLIAGLTGGALGCGEGSESNDPADELPPPAIMRDLVELDPGIGLESGAGTRSRSESPRSYRESTTADIPLPACCRPASALVPLP